TVALTAIFFAGDVLAGTPFVPYDVLDWMARNLPGGLLTFGIDTMVNTITTFNLGETSAAAKNAEHIMGLAGMIVTGIVASAAFFAVMNSRDDEPSGYIPGVIL